MAPAFKIDLKEKFPHLANAPIVEAVIDIRARAQVEWEKEAVTERIKPGVGYPDMKSQMGFRHQIRLMRGEASPKATDDVRWEGLRFRSADGKQIPRFDRNGFSFSRLKPYAAWEELLAEAMRLWRVYVEVAQPTAVQRIGVRFINSILLPDTDFEEYLTVVPQTPPGVSLPFKDFLYEDLFAVPETLYSVRVIRTLPPPRLPRGSRAGLILDIDAFSSSSFPLQQNALERRLEDLRWLKNKIFFGHLTEKGVEVFK